MRLYGLTGGIGMGKSTAATLLSDLGIPIVDTDEIARRIVEPGETALAEIGSLLGADLIDTDGRLRRDELARRVFSDPSARKTLESILHPRIRAIWLAEAEAWRKQSRACGVVIIPLLFETDSATLFDATICIACSLRTQYQRLQARGWTSEHIEQRRNAQWPIDKKMALADFVVWTEGGLDIHREQLQRLFRDVR